MLKQILIRNIIVSFMRRAARALLPAAFALAFVIHAAAAPGEFDPTFGSGGRTVMPNAYGTINAAALQPDGKIVAVGISVGQDWLVMRFNADGSPDLSFDGDGWTTLGVTSLEFRDTARAVYVRPDGKILVAGTMATESVIAVACYNPNGTLDTAFGHAGLVQRGIYPSTFDANKFTS